MNNLPNTEVSALAVSDQVGEELLYLDGLNSGGHSLIPRDGEKVTVRTTTLEEIFKTRGLNTCSLLKIDIEGSEYRVLLATPKYIMDRISAIALEYHLAGHGQSELRQLTDFLRDCGFRLTTTPTDDASGMLYAFKADRSRPIPSSAGLARIDSS